MNAFCLLCAGEIKDKIRLFLQSNLDVNISITMVDVFTEIVHIMLTKVGFIFCLTRNIYVDTADDKVSSSTDERLLFR